jgi:hypothetical protein
MVAADFGNTVRDRNLSSVFWKHMPGRAVEYGTPSYEIPDLGLRLEEYRRVEG